MSKETRYSSPKSNSIAFRGSASALRPRRLPVHPTGLQLPCGVACSHDGPTSDRTPPIVMSITPPMGFNGIATNTTVALVFSESVAPATVTASTFNVQAATALKPGTITVSGTTATFTPASALAFETRYFIDVRDVEDIAGNAMQGILLSSFTTVTN